MGQNYFETVCVTYHRLTVYLLTLSSSCWLTHKALTIDLHAGMYCVHLWTYPHVQFFSFIYFSTNCLQISFGLSFFLFSVDVHLISTFGMDVGCILHTCLIHCYFLLLETGKRDGVSSDIQLCIWDEVFMACVITTSFTGSFTLNTVSKRHSSFIECLPLFEILFFFSFIGKSGDWNLPTFASVIPLRICIFLLSYGLFCLIS